MTLKSSDIIKRAQQIADLENSDFIGYYENIMLLNEQWVSIYQKICNSTSDYFLREISIANGDYLPEDFYQLSSVKDASGNLLLRRTKSNNDKTAYSYEIKNNQIILPVIGTYTMEYFPSPEFLTFPSDTEVTVLINNVLDASPSYILETSTSSSRKVYDIAAQEDIYSFTATGNGYIDEQSIMFINGTTVNIYDILEQKIRKTVLSAIAVLKRDNELFVLFKDRIEDAYGNIVKEVNISEAASIYLSTFDDNEIYINRNTSIDLVNAGESIVCQPFNIQIIDGYLYYKTKGSVVRDIDGYQAKIPNSGLGVAMLKVDKATGNGIISSNKVITTCMPDTELNFPDNLFYTVLAYRLAIRYKIKQNADISLTSYELQEAENQFYDSLNRDNNQAYRIQNVNYSAGRYW